MKYEFAAIMLMTSVLLLCTSAAARSGDAKLEDAVRKANSEWAEAMKTGDAAVIAAPYLERGIFIAVDGTCIQGRNEIEKMYRNGFQRAGFATATKIESKQITRDGDLAYESGYAEVSVMKEGKVVTRGAHYMTVWQRQSNAEWKILRNIVLP